MTGGNPLTDEELLLNSEAWEGDEDIFLPDGTAEVERLDAAAVSYLQHADSSPLYEHFRVVADKGQAPMRIDKYLATRMTGSSLVASSRRLTEGMSSSATSPSRATTASSPSTSSPFSCAVPSMSSRSSPSPFRWMSSTKMRY